jgi:hypothetical protein
VNSFVVLSCGSQGYPLDSGAFLRRSGLTSIASKLRDLAASSVKDLQVTSASAAEADIDELASQTHRAVRSLEQVHRAAIETAEHHPHRDALFTSVEQTSLDVHSIAHSALQPCLGPLVRLSDTRQAVYLPLSNGTITRLSAWTSHWSPHVYDVEAELVRAHPLEGFASDATNPLPLNPEVFRGRIVLFRRGGIPLAYKVRIAATHGALGAIIVDESEGCADERFDQSCVLGSTKELGEGWAQFDAPKAWADARIPAVIVARDAGRLLISMTSY